MNLDRLVALANAGKNIAARNGVVSTERLAWRISNQAERRAEVYLYGAMDGWEVDGADLAREIRNMDVDHIDLRVNSPGGLVFDGIAVHAALTEHPARVSAHVDGLAASAASFIIQAAEEREGAKASKLMIHDARGLVLGDPADMRAMADVLDDISDSIAEMYADRAGGKASDWRARMTKTSWYSAEQAKDAGLLDTVVQQTKQAENFDLRTQRIRARARAMALKG